MRKTINVHTTEPRKRSKPALTPEARENQIIALAMDEAEDQIRNHTASSQVLTHFLKLGTAKAQAELEKIKRENLLLEAKAKEIETNQRTKELYEEVITAMKKYTGVSEDEDVYDE